MSLPIQAKILRVLQERMVRPIGSKTEHPMDARIIVATNKDLEREVKEGRFREDLYYRVNVLPVHIPPLRERRSDIPQLAHHILRDKVLRNARLDQPPTIAPAALLLLCEYTWPGNVRELENILERLALLVKTGQGIQLIDVEAVFSSLSLLCLKKGREQSSLENYLDRAKKERLEMALTLTRGNKAKAAHLLGMKRPAFTRLHKRLSARVS